MERRCWIIDSVYIPQEVPTFLKLINWVTQCADLRTDSCSLVSVQEPIMGSWSVTKCLLDVRITTTRNQTVVNGVIGLRWHYMTPCGAFSNGSQNFTIQFYWTCMLTTFDPILIKYLQLLKMAVLQRQMQTYRADKRYRGHLVRRVPLPPLRWSGEGSPWERQELD